MAEANENVRHRLEKMVRHKLKHNESWCGESQQERQAQAGKKLVVRSNHTSGEIKSED